MKVVNIFEDSYLFSDFEEYERFIVLHWHNNRDISVDKFISFYVRDMNTEMSEKTPNNVELTDCDIRS